MSDDQGVGTESKPSLTSRVIGIVGIPLYVLVGWFYVASGLVVPFPWFLALWAIWAVGFFVLIKVFRAAPAWTPLVPVVAAGVWVGFVQLGSWLFGWTA